MSRLDGGVGTFSSISRNCLRTRSSRGDFIVPAPAPVPVDRFVGIGFVGPRRVLPVLGVCARVASRPVPPRFAAGFDALRPARTGVRIERFADEPFSFPGRRGCFACLRLALALGVFARAVLRFPPRLAALRPRAPVRVADAVRFRPLAVLLLPFFAITVSSPLPAGTGRPDRAFGPDRVG
jgi:hypothetical protein